MTRQQVAKRLGRSLATVRRLEGVRLHAVPDARGVHHFDPDEVEALALDIDNGEVTLWQELGTSASSPDADRVCSQCQDLAESVARLRKALTDQRSEHETEIRAIKTEHDREARALTAELQEFLSTLSH